MIDFLPFVLFGPWQQAYSALTVLIAIDFGLSFWVFYKKREQKVLKLALNRLIDYILIVVIINQVKKAIDSTHFSLIGDYGISISVAYLVISEAVSCLKNLEVITGQNLRLYSPKILLEMLGLKKEDDKK